MLLSYPSEIAMDSDPLVDACRAGSHGAWKELYDAHFDFVWRSARRLGLSEAEAEDAAQDVFQVVWQQFGQFRCGRFTTWLYRIVANVVSARLRRAKVRSLFASWWGAEVAIASRGSSGQLDARQTLGEVERVLRQLSREKREAFVLFEIEGRTHQEIAELTQAKVETVRTRVFYARKDFERLMAQLEESL